MDSTPKSGKEESETTVGEHILVDTVDRLCSGKVDLREYVGEICARIETLDNRIKALLPEPDRLQRLFDEIAVLRSNFNGQLPPLYGVPVAIKDIFHVEGLQTRAGSQLPPKVLAGPESSCVKKLRSAGVLVLGKAVTTEFACFKSGPTRNPRNLEHSPGGSSSGSAAAVAAGYCPLALGSQTIGSIVRPAAFCGVVGFKPSYGRVNTGGFIHCSPSVDTIGTFTQDVCAAVVAASVICDDWRKLGRENSKVFRRPVLGVPTGPYLDQMEAPSRLDFYDQLTRLQTAGYDVVEVPAYADISVINDRHRRMMVGEMAQVHEQWYADHGAVYDGGTADLIEQGRRVSDEEIATGRNGRTQLRGELDDLLRSNGLDLWACPAATGPAPKGLTTTGDPIMNLPWTHAGLPTVSLPAGMSSDTGMPLGLQFVASFGRDEELLSWASQIEQDLGDNEAQ